MRSGTTLVQRFLCTAPDVNDFVPEVRLLREMVSLYKTSMTLGAAALEPYFADADACTHYFAACIGDLLQATRDRHNPQGALVLKNPELAMIFPELAQLRPTAKFLIVVRDPRDCVASMKSVAERARAAGQTPPMPEMANGAAGMATLYLRYYANVITSPLIREPDRVLFIRYEDIVTSPAAAEATLSRWSGLEFRLDAIASATAGDDGSIFGSSLYGRPISKEAMGSFRNRLDSAEIATVESVTAKFMETFGYASLAHS